MRLIEIRNFPGQVLSLYLLLFQYPFSVTGMLRKESGKVISREESSVTETSDTSVVDETFREEVQLFDWELLQQEVEDYLFSNQSKCEIENAWS